MAQLYQQPQHQQRGFTQQSTGSQLGQQSGQQLLGAQGMGGQQSQVPGGIVQYDEFLSNEIRTPMHDFSRLKKSAEWAAEQAHRTMPQDVQLSRILEDVADVAELNEKLLVRESSFALHQGQAFVQIAQQALSTLQNYAQQPFIPAVEGDIVRTINSIQELISTIGQGTQQGIQTGQQTQHGLSTLGQVGGPQQSGMGTQQFGMGTQQMGGQPQQRGGF